jgi:hypothetical protein
MGQLDNERRTPSNKRPRQQGAPHAAEDYDEDDIDGDIGIEPSNFQNHNEFMDAADLPECTGSVRRK